LVAGLLLIAVMYINSQKELFDTKKKLVFYEIYTLASSFLEEILNEYNKNRQTILKANDYVVKNLTKDIHTLKDKLGKHYHIFVTDKNFIIKNTTFKYDQNFSLAFAKDIFMMHKNNPGISPPICEPATTKFFTFSDRYINGRVVQVGYVLDNKKTEEFKNKIKKFIKQNPYIRDVTLYFIHPKTKYAQECKILTPLHRKYTLNEMIQTRKVGFELYKKLLKQNPVFTKNAMYILAKNPFNNESYMIFKLTINGNLLNSEIKQISLITLLSILAILGFAFLILTYIKKILNHLEEFTKHIKNKTPYNKKTYKKLDEVITTYNSTLKELNDAINSKDDFINFAMHELATPINILALYTDEYKELRPAIKKLISSYKNMSFYIHNHPQKKEKIDLKKFIEERIEYFKEITKEENKTIISDLEEFTLCINRDDLEMLIDNNIKNAIKYSTGNEIKITLKNKTLSFQNEGHINDMNKIFEKFYREENVKGGFGLGLYIIKTITRKYNMKISARTDNNRVIFEYDLKETNENCDS